MRQVRTFVTLATVVVLVPGVFAAHSGAAAQTQPTQPAPLTQQQVNEEILRELRSIRVLLEKMSTTPQAAPQPQVPLPRTLATITNLKGYAMGKPDAPLTMVEFTDLQCPYCREYVTVTFDEIKRNWIDTGKLRYISRDFPLDIHPFAMPAARAARCAGEQGKFWEMRMALMRNANLLSADYIRKTADDLKLNQKAFAACAAGTKYDAEIKGEVEEGFRLGVGGTPTFVIGKTTPESVQGPMIVGAMPYAAFDARLKDLSSGR
jgi:protein-disulfide isomerase